MDQNNDRHRGFFKGVVLKSKDKIQHYAVMDQGKIEPDEKRQPDPLCLVPGWGHRSEKRRARGNSDVNTTPMASKVNPEGEGA